VVLFKISWVGWRASILEGIPEGYYPIFHISLLDKYHKGNELLPAVKLASLKKNQQHYKPEKIIAHGIDDDTQDTIFLVAWKGYPLDEATWELFESLVPGSEEILEKFYKQHPELKQDQLSNIWKRKNNEPNVQIRKKNKH
jgi:hypothetical protein